MALRYGKAPAHGAEPDLKEPAPKKNTPPRSHGLDAGVCPACGKRLVPLTNAERQRAYRERKKERKT